MSANLDLTPAGEREIVFWLLTRYFEENYTSATERQLVAYIIGFLAEDRLPTFSEATIRERLRELSEGRQVGVSVRADEKLYELVC